MIKFENVTFGYDSSHHIVENLNFHINKGENVGLIGANGAGKSTILKLITGILVPEGSISIDSLMLNKENLSHIREKLGVVLQDSDDQMFMPTVREDMMFGPKNYGISDEEIEKRMTDILEQLHISFLKDRHNHKLSGGEKRMAAIATILMMKPECMIMDEPTAALDPYNRRLVINTIQSLPMTKLITSHDLDMIYDTCDRVILLSEGKIIADDSKDVILKDKELLEQNHLELPLRFQN